MPNTVQASNYYCDEKVSIGDVTNKLVNCLLEDKNISPIKLDNKLAYKINVIPTDYGSEKVIKVADLDSSYPNLELSYDLSFANNFDFAMGGKLLGLAPNNILSGGIKRDDNAVSGWSVRTVFGKSGGVGAYFYLPNDQQKYGNFFYLNKVNLKVDTKYKITLKVAVNTEKQRGKICLSASQYSEGGLQLLHEKCKGNLVFSNNSNKQDYISKLLFSFFHGGHSKVYSPKGSSSVNFNNIELSTKEESND
ncbi:polysaccharide lyase [Pseudoalteromonas nigrifaciens]|uniref:polysaccharide lyase n=1 Tax=Pseudoalteromonas nigrifaciens TaxID=28109 RepID=UPI0018694703|nr:hypothetical protein [Pseudoalteromonas nigrifaciens]